MSYLEYSEHMFQNYFNMIKHDDLKCFNSSLGNFNSKMNQLKHTSHPFGPGIPNHSKNYKIIALKLVFVVAAVLFDVEAFDFGPACPYIENIPIMWLLLCHTTGGLQMRRHSIKFFGRIHAYLLIQAIGFNIVGMWMNSINLFRLT